MKLKSENPFKLVGIILGIIGALFLLASIFAFVADQQFKASAKTTTAVITEIYTYRNGDDTKHDVFVTYTVDGVTYEEELGSYSSSMHEGKEIEIYYQPDNPRRISTDTPFVVFIVFVGLGGIFFAIGVVLLIKDIKKNTKNRRLLKEGVVCQGIITNVVRNTNVRINKKYPYKAECQVIDQSNGNVFYYSSEDYLQDISFLVGLPVTVYVDRQDPSLHYIDMNSALAAYNQSGNSSGQQVFDYR